MQQASSDKRQTIERERELICYLPVWHWCHPNISPLSVADQYWYEQANQEWNILRKLVDTFMNKDKNGMALVKIENSIKLMINKEASQLQCASICECTKCSVFFFRSPGSITTILLWSNGDFLNDESVNKLKIVAATVLRPHLPAKCRLPAVILAQVGD